ncbi:MAG TPA: LLM class flavin-dependent oxidoreductase [Amycolatopsis sp.]|nr:LLM class flavin-dependent oxidoreductase [Amycolatopsis sp.]
MTEAHEVLPPFSPLSVSIGIYVYQDRRMADPVERLDEMVDMARTAEQLGFDGVTASEHHRGRSGYMPNPLQLMSMYLHETERTWAAGCPMLLPLRVPGTLAEELAWLNARFPDRVGMTFAAGADNEDFAALGVPFESRAAAYEKGLRLVSDVLSGRNRGALGGDPAIARCAGHPIPLSSGSMTRTGVRRAARCGVGVTFGRRQWQPANAAGTGGDPVRELLELYASAGGRGPKVYTTYVFVGRPPEGVAEGIAERNVLGPAAAGLKTRVIEQPPRLGGTVDEIVEDWLDALAAGMDCVNMRIPYHGMPLSIAREQLLRIGEEVLPAFRKAVAGRPPS